MKRAIFALLLIACGYPPSAGYVTESPPPATDQNLVGVVEDDVTITEGAATGFVFLVYAPSTFSGTRPATDVRSLDDSIVRVLRSTEEGTVQYGSPSYTGRVFVLVGQKPGVADVEVSRNGDDTDRLRVTVVAQSGGD